jgi:hypothetical protein
MCHRTAYRSGRLGRFRPAGHSPRRQTQGLDAPIALETALSEHRNLSPKMARRMLGVGNGWRTLPSKALLRTGRCSRYGGSLGEFGLQFETSGMLDREVGHCELDRYPPRVSNGCCVACLRLERRRMRGSPTVSVVRGAGSRGMRQRHLRAPTVIDVARSGVRGSCRKGTLPAARTGLHHLVSEGGGAIARSGVAGARTPRE